MKIQIVGTLRSCSQNHCVITDSMMAGAKWLGVDLSKERRFDLGALIRHRMVIEGRFDATCLSGKAICLDSPTMMHDARIVEVP